MTYEEALHFIKLSEQYGSVLGLENMRKLLKELDNPQDKLKFVHIAGTNGKGSTAAYIANILASAGYLVGRYISPAVFSYFEKIQITGLNKQVKKSSSVKTTYINNIEVAKYINRIKEICRAMTEEGFPHPTVFEIETAMAMLHFVKEKCDVVVLEVGLGGRLDATNVITTTECAVITSVSMDHMHILGNTLEKIAEEKAGIIKERIPVVSYDQEPEAKEVIESACRKNHSALTEADFNKIQIETQSIEETIFSYESFKHLKIRLLGENQVKNAVLAVLTAECLRNLGYSITNENIQNGLEHTHWRGRFEIIKKKPYFIIDGAHNEDAALSLEQNIKYYFGSKKIIFIIGVLADKDYDAVLRHTGKYADKIYTITPNTIRGLPADKLAKTALKYNCRVFDAGTVVRAVKMAYESACEEDVIIAFGSLSYLKEICDAAGVVLP